MTGGGFGVSGGLLGSLEDWVYQENFCVSQENFWVLGWLMKLLGGLHLVFTSRTLGSWEYVMDLCGLFGVSLKNGLVSPCEEVMCY